MVMGNLILTLLMVIPLGQESANIRVKVSLFEVPFMIVSWTTARVAEDGSVVGMTVGGSTTGSFPTGVVSLQNRLPADSYSVDIKSAIREYMAYSCIRAQDITVYEFAGHELIFNHQNEAGQEVAQERDGWPYWLSYRLAVEPAWKNEEQVGLALRLWIRRKDPHGLLDITGQVPEHLVLDQTVALKFGQTSLVGFPSTTSGPRSICWLAVSVEVVGRSSPPSLR
jgi:hypothetical protein